jgi:hypothetical protein
VAGWVPDAEVHLAGNVGGAARVGDTVHRATGPWTPAVHALLGYLAGRVPHIPRVLGYDAQGREVLSYLPGHVLDEEREQLSTPCRSASRSCSTGSRPRPRRATQAWPT